MRQDIRATASILIFSLMVACSTTRPSVALPEVVRPAHTDSSVIVDKRGTTWNPRIVSERRQYFMNDSSVVSISNDTTARTVPIESRAIYTITITDAKDQQYILALRVDSQTVNNRPLKPIRDSSKVIQAQIKLGSDGRLINSEKELIQSCSAATVSPAVRMSEILLPFATTQLHLGDHWADTSTSMICHGKIPLMQKTVREYELVSFTNCAERSAVNVRRIVTSTFTVSSTDSTNHLSASGSGTGMSMMCVDRGTGALLESDGQSRLDLTITTSRGTFPFTQNTATHIKLR